MKETSMIFLVDDDRITNMINSEIIRLFDKGIQVACFTSAVEAFEELKNLFTTSNFTKAPDTILLDINMRDIDGWEFLNCLEQIPDSMRKSLKVYILTSSIHPDDKQRSMQYRTVHGYICKPLNGKHIQSIVNGKSDEVGLKNL